MRSLNYRTKKINFCLFLIFTFFLILSCGPTQVSYVTKENKKKPISLALEYEDFKKAAMSLTEKLLKSKALYHPQGGRYVISVATIKNDTTQQIDVDQLLSDIKTALLNSGKVVISSAVSTTDYETMLKEIRKLRGSEEFNQRTLPGKYSLIAPDYLLSGKIIQRVYYSGSKKYVDYYFILKLIDVSSGLIVWEGKEVIRKEGSANLATW